MQLLYMFQETQSMSYLYRFVHSRNLPSSNHASVPYKVYQYLDLPALSASFLFIIIIIIYFCTDITALFPFCFACDKI